MGMRFHLIAIVPLLLAAVALVMAGGVEGQLLPLTAGLAAATVFVALATLFQYLKPRAEEVRKVPIENFFLWADVGAPGAELERLSPDDVEAAARIAGADLGLLSSNADLINDRIALLCGRPEFEELTREKFNDQTKKLVHDLRAAVEKLRGGLRVEVLDPIEQCASQADRIANKLFDFQRGKPELVHIYIEPLRRAAEKLSRDLRLASQNISNFIENASKSS
jgi:hypothetical protein